MFNKLRNNKYLIKVLLIILVILNIPLNQAASINTSNTIIHNISKAEKSNTDCENSQKIAYLTFDDGPSKNTEMILNILNKNNIKATFFIVGPIFKEDLEFTKRAVKEGHTIGNHTYDHDYEDIYISESAFWNNFDKCQKLIESITEKPCKIFRFPGGSFNCTVKRKQGKKFIEKLQNGLKEKDIKYFDWNVDSCDGINDGVPSCSLIKNVKKDIKGKNDIIVLMHDSKGKKSTVEALPEIIKLLMDNGYTFKTLEDF